MGKKRGGPLIISPAEMNRHIATVIVAPMTSQGMLLGEAGQAGHSSQRCASASRPFISQELSLCAYLLANIRVSN
jgi:mRNA-degrading endonuclease toxin of MazEF toxin-antitoxin module